jgi:hypothetical protein
VAAGCAIVVVLHEQEQFEQEDFEQERRMAYRRSDNFGNVGNVAAGMHIAVVTLRTDKQDNAWYYRTLDSSSIVKQVGMCAVQRDNGRDAGDMFELEIAREEPIQGVEEEVLA